MRMYDSSAILANTLLTREDWYISGTPMIWDGRIILLTALGLWQRADLPKTVGLHNSEPNPPGQRHAMYPYQMK